MSALIDIAITENPVVSASLSHVASITEMATGFGFTTLAFGGFATASFNIVCDEVTAWQFLNDHVGRRLVLTNPLAQDSDWIVWEGMIYNVIVEAGNGSVSRSMADVFNRVAVTYSTIDTNVSPPIPGQQATTAETNDTTSQGLYGIRHLRRVIGGSTSAEAVVLRDQLLKDFKNPRALSDDVMVGAGDPGEISLRVECLGFAETLNNRFFAEASVASASLDTQIKNCLTSVGQFISSDQSNIVANTYSRVRYQAGEITARDFIDALVSLGDGATARRVFWGVYAGRKFHTSVEGTTPDYIVRKRDAGYRCYDYASGAEIMPWLIQPGKIVQLIDLLPDAVSYSTELDNARSFVIGEVSFVAPWTAILTPLTGTPSDMIFKRMGATAVGRNRDVIITGGPQGSDLADGDIRYANTATGRNIITGEESQLYTDQYISGDEAEQMLAADMFARDEAIAEQAARDRAIIDAGNVPMPFPTPPAPPTYPNDPRPVQKPPPGLPEGANKIADNVYHDPATGNVWMWNGSAWSLKRPYDMPTGWTPAWQYESGYWIDPSGQWWKRGQDDGEGEGWEKSAPLGGTEGTKSNNLPPGYRDSWVPVNNGMYYDPVKKETWEKLPNGTWGIKP